MLTGHAVTGRGRRYLSALGLALALTGCATSGNPKDPIEGYNRAMFAINDGVDQAVVRPVAVGYDAVLPSPIRKGVTNFFGNIADVFTGVNNILQGKIASGVSDFGRVVVNTTIGILGLFDVASEVGMEKHDEDFGQTFGSWGIPSGAYVVLPLLGPSTVRDTFGKVLDMETNPVANINDVATRNSLLLLSVVDLRASLLPADKLVEAAALDKYSYVRDAYLQHRVNVIYDGEPPISRAFDDDTTGIIDAELESGVTVADHSTTNAVGDATVASEASATVIK
ncbi:MAG: VacJ family lipoprotein [Rhodocyclaceae bacterium]|nr:VacJ family lipoprotein [Rhodocyclaceae bacterium]